MDTNVETLNRIIFRLQNVRKMSLSALWVYKNDYIYRDKYLSTSIQRKQSYSDYRNVVDSFNNLQDEIKLLKQIRHNIISSGRLAEEYEEFFGDI